MHKFLSMICIHQHLQKKTIKDNKWGEVVIFIDKSEILYLVFLSCHYIYNIIALFQKVRQLHCSGTLCSICRSYQTYDVYKCLKYTFAKFSFNWFLSESLRLQSAHCKRYKYGRFYHSPTLTSASRTQSKTNMTVTFICSHHVSTSSVPTHVSLKITFIHVCNILVTIGW